MRTEKLPALNTKKEANVISITNAKVTGIDVAQAFANGVVVSATENGEGFQFKIPAENFSYNQFDSLDEFVADCGGIEKALEIINDYKRSSALDEAKIAIRTTTNNDVDTVVSSAIKQAADHTFSGSNKISGREAKELLTDLRAQSANLDDAALAAMVRKMMGM